MPATADFAFAEATVESLGLQMSAGEISSSSLTRAYLERIEALDGGERGLHSVIETNPDAAAIARSLDDERQAGRVRGPLHGIPVLVKDNIETADALTTSAGSLALAGHRGTLDSFLVARLRAAGAVILGKANLSEWANFRSLKSSSGWSARGGQCRNPYALDRNPGGSSSGCGAATSANLCALSIGTETDGSIVSPASACGLVGLKPTVGLVSRAGIIPISRSQDTAGPMTRTVADAAALLTVIAASDPRDTATREATAKARDYCRDLDPGGLKGARIGIARAFQGDDESVGQVLEDALSAMRHAGAEIIDTDLSAGFEYLPAEFAVLLHEFKADLNAFLASRAASVGVATLKELIDFNFGNAAKEMPFFGQEIFELAETKTGLDAPEYRAAREMCLRLSRAEGIDRALAGHRLDAIVCPTGGPAWLTDHANGDSLTGLSSSRPAAVSGYPAITVPMGFVHGLPLGLTFMAAAWSESTLLRLAYAFERLGTVRRVPRLLDHAPIA